MATIDRRIDKFDEYLSVEETVEDPKIDMLPLLSDAEADLHRECEEN